MLVEPPGGRDPRLEVKARVIGIRLDGHALAVPRTKVVEAAVLRVSLARQESVLWHRPGQRSALDAAAIADGDEIGTVGAFDPRLRGRRLTFDAARDGFRDRQTGSTWNVMGEAVDGPLRGRRLRPVTHLDTFWFAWVAFQPDTDLYGSGERGP